MKKIILKILLMNISKWKKAHNKDFFTSVKMTLVNYEEFVNLPFLGIPICLPLSFLTMDQRQT